VVDKGIYYLDTKGTNSPAREAPGLATSADRKTILYTQLDGLNSDVILVENFR